MDNRIARAYDSIAPGFAARFAQVPPDLLPLMETLVAHVARGGLIIDVGCGHGRDVVHFSSATRVLGADLSFGMLQEARRATQSPLAQMDMAHLALRNDVADGIWCCAALLHVPKRTAPTVLRELRRVLKPKGMLIVSVQQGSHDGPRDSDAWGVSRHFSDYEPDEMRALLFRCGFELRTQISNDVGPVTWLQSVCLADQ